MEHNGTLLFLKKATLFTAEAFDILGVSILAIGIAIALVLLIRSRISGIKPRTAISNFKVGIGQTMLLGLEVLIAADIVKTVALEVTLTNMSALGLLVAVRTFLRWTLELEIDGKWPWQKA